MESYLKSIGKTAEDLHHEWHPMANTRVKRSLALGKVIEDNDIKVEPADIDKEIEDMTKDAGEKKESLLQVLNNQQVRETIERRLVSRKAVNYLAGIASGQEGNKPDEKEEKDE
jgi:FKBP-type peptidyl-prolyl cis-trans isomerase (trigger factor)